MQSKRQPGLFFIGEVLDVTGWLGGYNFQWHGQAPMRVRKGWLKSSESKLI